MQFYDCTNMEVGASIQRIVVATLNGTTDPDSGILTGGQILIDNDVRLPPNFYCGTTRYIYSIDWPPPLTSNQPKVSIEVLHYHPVPPF